jgi:uncharacterized protein
VPITALYAALLCPLLVFLSFRVIGYRRDQKVEIGDGNDRQLMRRMRVHANFVEYTPYALILMGLAESLAAPGLLVHALGLTLLGGRHLHAYALSQTPHLLQMRVLGMVLTLTVLMAGAATCALFALWGGKLL